MPEPLHVVDVQRGYINEFTQHIPGRIKRLIHIGDYAPVLSCPTRCRLTHPLGIWRHLTVAG